MLRPRDGQIVYGGCAVTCSDWQGQTSIYSKTD